MREVTGADPLRAVLEDRGPARTVSAMADGTADRRPSNSLTHAREQPSNGAGSPIDEPLDSRARTWEPTGFDSTKRIPAKTGLWHLRLTCPLKPWPRPPVVGPMSRTESGPRYPHHGFGGRAEEPWSPWSPRHRYGGERCQMLAIPSTLDGRTSHRLYTPRSGDAKLEPLIARCPDCIPP